MLRYLNLFGIEIPTYGIWVTLGIILGVFVLTPWLGMKRGIRPKEWLLLLLPVAPLGILAGLLTDGYLKGGLAGMIPYVFKPEGIEGVAAVGFGMFTYLVLVYRRHPGRVFDFNDALAPGAAFLVGLIKTGCWFGGCCYGHPTSGWFSISFPRQTFPWMIQYKTGIIGQGAETTVPVIPAQPMEMAYAFLLGTILLVYYRRGIARGNLLWIFNIAYLCWRIGSEWLIRADPYRGELGPITITQGISFLLIAMTGGFMLHTAMNLHKARPLPSSGRDS